MDKRSIDTLVSLLAAAREAGGDCLHLKPGSVPRARCGEQLRPLAAPPVTAAQTEQLASELLSEGQRSRLASEQAIEISLLLEEPGRLRVRLFRQRGSLEILVRPVRHALPTLAGLGLPLSLKSLQNVHGGLVVVAAPAGGGKSSTVAALVNHLNRNRACHILTIDDPTEFVHRPMLALVDQVEVGRDTPSPVAALQAASRQDVDVVVVETPSDPDAVELALHLAETGRLVLISVGASTPAAAIEWLAERAPASQREVFRARLAAQLEILLLQAVLRRIDQEGRVLVCDLYLRSRPLAQFVRDPPPLREGSRPAVATDASMDAQLVALARKGQIAWEEAAAHAVDKAEIERAIMFD